jgi:hypothetical protein
MRVLACACMQMQLQMFSGAGMRGAGTSADASGTRLTDGKSRLGFATFVTLQEKQTMNDGWCELVMQPSTAVATTSQYELRLVSGSTYKPCML